MRMRKWGRPHILQKRFVLHLPNTCIKLVAWAKQLFCCCNDKWCKLFFGKEYQMAPKSATVEVISPILYLQAMCYLYHVIP